MRPRIRHRPPRARCCRPEQRRLAVDARRLPPSAWQLARQHCHPSSVIATQAASPAPTSPLQLPRYSRPPCRFRNLLPAGRICVDGRSCGCCSTRRTKYPTRTSRHQRGRWKRSTPLCQQPRARVSAKRQAERLWPLRHWRRRLACALPAAAMDAFYSTVSETPLRLGSSRSISSESPEISRAGCSTTRWLSARATVSLRPLTAAGSFALTCNSSLS